MILRNPMRDHPRRREDVASVQEMLKRLGYRVERGPVYAPEYVELIVDGIYGDDSEAVVMSFQEDEGILADGIVGPQTLRTLEAALARREIELTSPGADSLSAEEYEEGQEPDYIERYHLAKVNADKYGEGYTRFSLRSDAANAYNAVRKIVNDHGGIITSSGGIRSLSANVSSNRSATSFHYVGRAFDLFVYSGMVNEKKDPFVIAKGDEPRTWRVYARCTKKGTHAKDMNISGVVTYKSRDGSLATSGKFLDLTALMAEHGFKPIRARKSFERGGSPMGAEWWHFQYEKGLVQGMSTFGSELLKLYAQSTLEPTAPWRYRERVFGVSWG